MNRANKEVELAIKYAMSFIGTPYLWGGDDPMSGFDCSGFCIEILKAIGKLPYIGDWSAQDLYGMFREVEEPSAGCLVFWGKATDQIGHIELCIDEERAIGAGGGDSKITTVQDAIRANAYVRIRPIKRPDKRYLFFCDPF